MSFLQVNGLCKQYDGRPAVDNLSFSVEAGEIFGLLGPNGAGKTTTMSMICGLVRPDRGEVLLDGASLRHGGSSRAPLLGVVPQDLAIYPELTALENLEFFARLYGLRGTLLRERIDAALEMAGLTAHAARRSGKFSGGMKRRLNFAVAVLHRPRLLILDEPTVGVDPQSRAHLLQSVRELACGGMAVVYASHYMDEIEALCRRVGIIDHGHMLSCGSLDALLAEVHPNVQLELSPWSESLRQRLSKLAEINVVPLTKTPLKQQAGDRRTAATRVQLCPREGELPAVLIGVMQELVESRVSLLSIETAESNLEQLFLKLTGSSLRD